MDYLISKTFEEDSRKIMADLGITDYWFKDNQLVISKNVKHYTPPKDRELYGSELSIIELLGLTPVGSENA